MRLLAVLVCLALCLAPAACGEAPSGPDTPSEPSAEFDGLWAGEDGSVLSISAADGRYRLQSAAGRIGSGPYTETDGAQKLEFDRFYYTLTADGEDGLLLTQNGASDQAESLDGLRFTRGGDAALDWWEPMELDGVWEGEDGTLLTLDLYTLAYTAEAGSLSAAGTIADADDGRGIYLALNGHAYPILSADCDSLTLQFVSGDLTAPDGRFETTFHRKGSIGRGDVVPGSIAAELAGFWYPDGDAGAPYSLEIDEDDLWQSVIWSADAPEGTVTDHGHIVPDPDAPDARAWAVSDQTPVHRIGLTPLDEDTLLFGDSGGETLRRIPTD